MRRFTTKLLLAFTGVTFIGFLMVYFLFNVFIDNYIMLEAERELTNSSKEIAQWHDSPHDTYVDIILRPFDASYEEVNLMPTLLMPVQSIYFLPSRESVLQTEFIVLNDQDEIIFPILGSLTQNQQAELKSLATFYTMNRSYFAEGAMVRLDLNGSTYYLKSVATYLFGSSVSYLLYTNATSTMAFRHSMNQALLILLVGLAILCSVIAIIMSSRFKSATKKLCNYAETIGKGNFTESLEKFNDEEFDQLYKSMGDMSNMLQAYEDNQKKFFQNVSHELKAPLMLIQGYGESVLNGIFDKEKAIPIILAEGEKMKELIDGILLISKLDSGFEVVNILHPVNIKNLILDCHERLRAIVEKANKQIIINHPPDEEISIKTDDDKLEMVIVNILSNAIRHAKSRVEISYSIKMVA